MAKARRRTRVKTPPLLIAKTQSLLKKIQPKVDGVLLTYWTSTSGSVCDNDVMALHELLQDAGPPAAAHPLREVGRRQRHGRAAHGASAAPVHASA